jgi:hypothetical protein
MNDYSYEIVKYLPEANWIKVVYSRDGDEDYIRMFTLTSFDEAEIREHIEGYAPVVFDQWSKRKAAPMALPIQGKQSAVVKFPKTITEESVDRSTVDYFLQTVDQVVIETEDQIIYREVVRDTTEEERILRAEIRCEDMLKQTDWWVLSDTPEPTQEQLDYRQAIRDVPQQSGFPDNINWPTL